MSRPLIRFMSVANRGERAINHNTRSIRGRTPDNIDPKKSPSNYALLGGLDANQLLAVYRRKITSLGTIRKNAPRLVEIVFTAAHDIEDHRGFFAQCLAWTQNRFDAPLSFIVHLDESTIHAHALIFPLLDGRLSGRVLGSKATVLEHRQDFYRFLGMNCAPKLHGEEREKLLRRVLRHAADEGLMSSKAWPEIRNAIDKNLTAFENCYRGFEEFTGEKSKPLSCVALSAPAAPNMAENGLNNGCLSDAPAAEPDLSRLATWLGYLGYWAGRKPSAWTEHVTPSGYSRVQDDHLPSGLWDAERGEFRRPPASPKPATILH